MGAGLDRRGLWPPVLRWLGTPSAARAHLDKQLSAAPIFRNELQNSLDVMLLEPVNNEAVRCEQTQHFAVVDCLQGANPGVELLLGKLGL